MAEEDDTEEEEDAMLRRGDSTGESCEMNDDPLLAGEIRLIP